MSKSVIFKHAAEQWQEMKRAYEDYVDYAYLDALDGTAFVLVNQLGRVDGVDGLSLFTGSKARAYKYASEELIDWWESHPRLSLEDYEAQWVQGVNWNPNY